MLVRIGKSVVALGLLGAAIEAFMVVAHVSPAAFARPSEILSVLPQFMSGRGFLQDVWSTVWRTLIAFIIAVPSGIIAGFLVENVRLLRVEGEFIVDFLRSIPATALIPVFMLIFGPQGAARIAVAAFSGALAVALSILVGFRELNQDRKLVASLLGLEGWRRISLYELPEMMPALVVGLRTAISLCLILVVVAEMFIGARSGLGWLIQDRRYSDAVPVVYGAILVTGVVGYLFNHALRRLEAWVRIVLVVESSAD